PNEAIDNTIKAVSEQPAGSPVDPNVVVGRAARKRLRPRAPAVTPPTSEYSRAALPDLSSFGELVEDAEPEAPAAAPLAPAPQPEPPKHNAFMRGFVSGMVKENPEGLGEALE